MFRAVPVFHVGQTDPLPGREPIALEPPCEPISGDSHARLLTPLENLAADLGYSVRHLPLDGGADGWCDAQRYEIVVNDHLPANARIRVLVHELAHALGIRLLRFRPSAGGGTRRLGRFLQRVAWMPAWGLGSAWVTGGTHVPLNQALDRRGRRHDEIPPD